MIVKLDPVYCAHFCACKIRWMDFHPSSVNHPKNPGEVPRDPDSYHHTYLTSDAASL
jgi:hypothetical protein